MATFWEWDGSESSSKDLEEFQEAPNPVTGGYGRTVLHDNRPPKPTVQLTSHGMTYAETETEYAKHLARATDYTFTPVSAESPAPTVTGRVVGFQCESIKGTGLYRVTLTIRRTDKT